MAVSFAQIKQLLLAHYSAPLEVSFRQFRHGAIFFGIGMGLMLTANAYLPSSAKQEILVFLGLCMLAYGFMVAMLAQVRMLISRFVIYFRKPKYKVSTSAVSKDRTGSKNNISSKDNGPK